MHHHKTFNSFLDKYLEGSFLLPTSHLSPFLYVRNLVFSVIPSHCDIINSSPPPLSKSCNMLTSLHLHAQNETNPTTILCASPPAVYSCLLPSLSSTTKLPSTPPLPASTPLTKP